MSWAFYIAKEEWDMLGMIGGILVIVGTTIKAIDDLTNNK